MSDPSPAPSTGTLSYDPSPIRYAGLRDIRATLRILGWVFIAAVASAAALIAGLALGVWPTLIAGVCQGIIAGLFCRAAFKRYGVHQVRLATILAGFAGLAGLLMVHGEVWLRDCFTIALQVRPTLIGAVWETVQIGHSASHQVLDSILAERTGFGGLLGSILWRASQNERIFGILLFHALGTIVGAALVGRSFPKILPCDRCGHDLPAARNAAVIPLAQGRSLYKAVARDDVEAVFSLMAQYANAPLGTSCSITKVIVCPGCKTIYAWIGYVTAEGDAMGPGLAISSPCVIITSEMLDALRSERAEPIIEQAATGEQQSPTPNQGDQLPQVEPPSAESN